MFLDQAKNIGRGFGARKAPINHFYRFYLDSNDSSIIVFLSLIITLLNYISKFTLKQIIEIESQDSQFLSLKNARNNISAQSNNEKIINQNIFLFLILQNGIVSYQIAGSGESRREEFSQKIIKDRDKIKNLLLTKKDNTNRRYDFLTTSKYNKRIYNIKKSRLVRFNNFLNEIDFTDENFFLNQHKNMYGLLGKISHIMKRPENSKTLTFSIKMFGYGARIVFDKLIQYPNEIQIPIDSRIQKIYEVNTGKKLSKKIDDILNRQKNKGSEVFLDDGVILEVGEYVKSNKSSKTVQYKKQIEKYFQNLSKKSGIPPLHLDSLLRIDYRKKYIKI